VAAERLIDRIVDNLPQAVHQPSGVGGADVHRRPFPDSFETLQDQQVPCLVVTAFRCWASSWHGLRVPRAMRQNGAKSRQSGTVSENEIFMTRAPRGDSQDSLHNGHWYETQNRNNQTQARC
jgi:hypothetical protein